MFLFCGSLLNGDSLVFMLLLLMIIKAAFWELLKKLNLLKLECNEPWIIGGDFNSIMFNSEKRGGANRKGANSKNFANCFLTLGVKDVRTVGTS